MLCKLFSLFYKKTECRRSSLEINTGLKKTILIVEDEPTQRIAFQKIVEKAGYRTLLAEDGKQGLMLAYEHKPDLILLDVVMPKSDGVEVCRQLKSNSSTRATPIIFLTGKNSPDDVVQHFEMGGDMHLSKPINAKELVDQIQKTFLNNIKY